MGGGTESFQADETIIQPACRHDGLQRPGVACTPRLLAGEQAVVLVGQEMTRGPVALGRADLSTGPYPERSYLQGAIALDGETLLQQPDRRMHRTGLGCTSPHGFRATAIFYPNFYPKVQ
jgi:hypothetical protein